jgi:hypothetical protein
VQSGPDIPPEHSRAGVDALQFAGLLLGASASTSVRTILFASASANSLAPNMIYETALSLRLIRGSRVAMILLCESKRVDREPNSKSSLEPSLSRDWANEGDSNLASFHWDRPNSGQSPVPASAFVDLMRSIEGNFDFILVDAGTIGASPQPILLAPLCNATVLLVKPGITTIAEVQSCKALLVQAQAHILGFAFVETV